jgi:hypothetical protein
MTVTVTIAGSAAQTVPYQSAQPPAGWRSLQVPVSNNAAQWMIAIVTWRQNTASAGVAVHVGDDTLRNFWTPLGAPSGTSSASGVTRTAIWTAPAAYPARYVLAAPAGLTPGTESLGLSCIVLNVAGLLPWQTLTGVSATFANSATALSALTQAAPSAQAILLTACGSDLSTATVSLAGTGWTSLSQVAATNGTDHTDDIVLNAAYQVTTASTSATWSSTATQDMSGVIAGVLVSGTPPAYASPDWPVTVCELALGAQSHTPADQLTWTPVTARSLQLDSLVQGAQYNLGQLTAGQGVMTFDNPDAELIAPGTGTFAGIASGTPFRIRQIWQGGAWQVSWTGNGTTASPQIECYGSTLPVTAGQSYTASAWLGSSVPWSGGMSLAIAWKTSGGTVISTSVTSVTAAGVPQAVTVTGTAPGTATQADLIIAAAGTPPAATTFYASATQPGTTGGYLQFPPGLTWNGENNATVTTLGSWTPDPKGPPAVTPYGVPFSGYIRSWPQSWDPDLLRGTTAATLTDAWTYCQGNLQPILIQEILNDNPYAYWPCIDAAGSAQASNYAKGNSNPLLSQESKYGAGGSTATFGANSTALLGAQGTYLLTSSVREQTEAGMWGLSGVNFAAGNPEGWSLCCIDGSFPQLTSGITWEVFFQVISPYNTTDYNSGILSVQHSTGSKFLVLYLAPTSGYLYLIDEDNNSYVLDNSINWLTGTSPLTHVALAITRTTYVAYVNGIQVAAGTFTAERPGRFQVVTANGYCGSPMSVRDAASGCFNGYVGHLAVFSQLLAPARIMTHYQAGIAAMTGDSADARIERLLQGGNNYPGRRVILQDSGSLVTPCASCQDIGGQAAGVSVQNIASSNAPAVLGVSPPGELFYLARGYVWNQAIRWVIGQNSYAGEIPYLGDLTVTWDPQRVINDVQLTQLDNLDVVTPQPPVSGIDYQSQEQNGDQSYWVTGYLENDLTSALTAGPGLTDLANWIGAVNAAPGNRVPGVTIDAASNPAAWQLFMTAAKGDMVTVNIRPVTAPAGTIISVTGRVSQTTRSLQWSRDGTKATINLLVDLSAEENALTWDDPVRGQLTGSNVLAW